MPESLLPPELIQTFREIWFDLTDRKAHVRMRGLALLKRQGIMDDILLRLLKDLAVQDSDDKVRAAAQELLVSPMRLLAPLHTKNASSAEMHDYLLQEIAAWEQEGLIGSEQADALRVRYGFERPGAVPAEAVAPAVIAAPPAPEKTPAETSVVARPVPPAPVPEERPAAPPPAPRPKRQPLQWSQMRDQLSEAFVSGALLRGLLYLGAFMIVVSAAVLVVLFWNTFYPPVQWLFIFMAPAALYGAGWLLLDKLKLPQAGQVLVGIGALMLAVDFAAIYQFYVLAVDRVLYWLIASFICTAVYGINARRMRTDFFDSLVLLGGVNILAAFVRQTGLAWEWSFVSIAAFSLAMVAAAARLRHLPEGERHPVRLLRYLACVFIPVSMYLILTWPEHSGGGQAALFALAALSFGLLAAFFPATFFAHAASWSVAISLAYFLNAIRVDVAWYAAVSAVTAALYFFADWNLGRRLAPDFAWRRTYPVAVRITAIILTTLAFVGGLLSLTVDWWAGVWAMALAALTLAGCAYLFRRPGLVFWAAMLFILPYLLAFWRWLPAHSDASMSYMAAACVGLMLIYQGGAAVLRRQERYAGMLHLVAHLGAALLAAWLLLSVGLMLMLSHADSWQMVLPLGELVLFYLLAAILYDSAAHPALSRAVQKTFSAHGRSSLFLWAVGLLLPVWVFVFCKSYLDVGAWPETALALLGLVYVGLGWGLYRREQGYRFTFQLLFYLIAATVLLLEIVRPDVYLLNLYLILLGLALQAWLYRSGLAIGLAGLLLVWVFNLTLNRITMIPVDDELAYSCLAVIVYLPIANALHRYGWKFSLSLYVIGYTLLFGVVFWLGYAAASYLLVSISGWDVGALLLAGGACMFAAYRLRQKIFACLAVTIFSLAYGFLWMWLNLPAQFLATVWVLQSAVLLLCDRWLVRSGQQEEWQPLVRALRLWAIFWWAGGLGFTTPGSIRILLGSYWHDGLYGLILPQVLAVGVAAWVAHSYRRSQFSYLAAGLSFFPFALAFLTYAPAAMQTRAGWAWLGWAVVLLLLGYALDRNGVRYAHGVYLTGYALCGVALWWSRGDQAVLLVTLAGVLLVALAGQFLVQLGRHRSFADLLDAARFLPVVLHRALRFGFAFVVAIALPLWLLLFLDYRQVIWAWRGVALALLAMVYVPAGLNLRRLAVEYTWPLYGTAFVLTLASLQCAQINAPVTMLMFALIALFYFLAAYTFRQALWLYVANAALIGLTLLVLNHYRHLTVDWISQVFMALAYVELLAARGLNRRRPAQAGMSPYALAFCLFACAFGILGLLLGIDNQYLAIRMYLLGAVFYGLCAVFFHKIFFLYPAVCLITVPYYLEMTLLMPAGRTWYGVGWFPMALAALMMGRFVFKGRFSLDAPGKAFSQAALPFYLLTYTLAVSMPLVALRDSTGRLLVAEFYHAGLFWALVADVVLFAISARLFAWPVWWYPWLVSVHLALHTAWALYGPAWPAPYEALPFVALTWLLAGIGYAIARRKPAAEGAAGGEPPVRLHWLWQAPAGRILLSQPGARPFLLGALFEMLLWQWQAHALYETAALAAVGYAVLLALLAVFWLDASLAYAALGFILLATWNGLTGWGVPPAWVSVWLGAIALLFCWLGILAEGRSDALYWRREGKVVQPDVAGVWAAPLMRVAVILVSLTLLANLRYTVAETMATAVSFAFGGAIFLTLFFHRGRDWAGYLGVFLVECSWILVLLEWEIDEPQSFAIPVGLYLAGLGYFEQRRERWPVLARLVECLGLAILLVTSFLQSLDGKEGFPYFLLLVVEAALVFWWGGLRRSRLPFLIGAGMSVVNVVAQVAVLVNVYEVNRWFVILGMGALLFVAGVFVERQRERIVLQVQHWRDELETWK